MKRVFHILIFVTLTLSNCAHIPLQSVQLNEMIGQSIVDQNRAYMNLLNDYFALKKQSIDQFIANEYTPKFMANVSKNMKSENITEIPDSVISMIMTMIIAKRDSMQHGLEMVHIDVISSVQQNANQIQNANAALTMLLKSAVDLDKATQSALSTVDTITRNKFNFSQFDQKFNQYLSNIGNGAGKITDLYQNANDLLKGGKQ